MNLFEYRLWEETRIWLIILVPLLLIFLFINPFISLALLFIIFARLIFVRWIQSSFDKTATQPQESLEEELNEMVTNFKSEIAVWKVNEILKLTEDFPGVFIDCKDENNEYIVTYKNETLYSENIPEMRDWLTTNFKSDENS